MWIQTGCRFQIYKKLLERMNLAVWFYRPACIKWCNGSTTVNSWEALRKRCFGSSPAVVLHTLKSWFTNLPHCRSSVHSHFFRTSAMFSSCVTIEHGWLHVNDLSISFIGQRSDGRPDSDITCGTTHKSLTKTWEMCVFHVRLCPSIHWHECHWYWSGLHRSDVLPEASIWLLL